ncbi:ATP-binding protein [Streptomyces sp. NPDC088400]|uniref:ATP-binding protein n=1 Tax=Streptomyces sp. NPDC088400 TaxID=3365861 RepID=UPI0038037FCB
MIGLIDTEGGACAEWTFPAEPNSVRAARHAVGDTLRDWRMPPSVGEVATLLVSELVTNSLRYASGPIGVRLAVRAVAAGSDGDGAGPDAAALDRAGPDRVRPDGSGPGGPGRDGAVPRRPGGPGGLGGAGSPNGHDGAVATQRGAALLVEISDPLPDPPTERPAGPEDEGGRGLQLVACSARRWGTRRGKTGKTVWFELPLPG